MSCDRFHALAAELALDVPVSTETQAHLASCPNCRGQAGRLRRQISLLHAELEAAQAAQPGADFLDRVRRRLAAERPSRAPAPRLLVPILGSILAIGVGLLLAGRAGRPPSPPRIASSPNPAPGQTRSLPTLHPPPRTEPPPRLDAQRARRPEREAVVVDRNEIDAIAGFADRPASATFRPEPPASPLADLPDAKEIAIAPINLEPLETESSSEAAPERSSS